MRFELIVDGDDSDVGGCDVILRSFFRVHLDRWPDLRRSHCEGRDEKIDRFGDQEAEQFAISSTEFLEDVPHSLSGVRSLLLLSSLFATDHLLLNDDPMVPQADPRGNTASTSLIPHIFLLVLLLLEGTLVYRRK